MRSLRYLPQRWRTCHERFGLRRAADPRYPVASTQRFASRTDAVPPADLPPRGDLDVLREQLLDRWGTCFGILRLFEVFQISSQPGDYGAALVRGQNDFIREEWLDREPHLLVRRR